VSIETVVLAPIVTACVLMTMQLSLTAFANIAVQSSAHAGAVALARGGDPVAAAAAHLPAYWVGAAQIRRVGDAVEVELDVPTFLTAGEFTVTGYAGAVVEKDVDEIPTSAEAP
jgi:hypothetical protein